MNLLLWFVSIASFIDFNNLHRGFAFHWTIHYASVTVSVGLYRLCYVIFVAFALWFVLKSSPCIIFSYFNNLILLCILLVFWLFFFFFFFFYFSVCAWSKRREFLYPIQSNPAALSPGVACKTIILAKLYVLYTKSTTPFVLALCLCSFLTLSNVYRFLNYITVSEYKL